MARSEIERLGHRWHGNGQRGLSWRTLSVRDRRAILIAGMVLALVAVARVGVLPAIRAAHEADAQLDHESRLLGREIALLSAAHAYPSALRTVGNELLALAPRLLPGETATTAQAALANQLREQAAQGPALLSRLDAVPSHAAGEGITAVSFEVAGESDLEGFLSLVSALEAGPTLVRLDDLVVETRAPVAPAAGTEAPGIVRFRFVATGFFLGRTSSGIATDSTVEPPRGELRKSGQSLNSYPDESTKVGPNAGESAEAGPNAGEAVEAAPNAEKAAKAGPNAENAADATSSGAGFPKGTGP